MYAIRSYYALGAIRAASLYGVGPEHVAAGLEAVSPLSGRTSVIRGEYTVVDDCYNANAESAVAAIGFCDDADARGRRLYVLGSMKELGAEAAASHRRVGEAAAASRADARITSYNVCYTKLLRIRGGARAGAQDANV